LDVGRETLPIHKGPNILCPYVRLPSSHRAPKDPVLMHANPLTVAAASDTLGVARRTVALHQPNFFAAVYAREERL